MRILQVIESFGGGSMQVVLTISQRLAAAGHELAIAHGSVAESPRDARAAVPAEIELFALQWGRAPRRQAHVVAQLRALVRSWSPDVVHLHSSFAGFAGAVGLRGSAPLVYTPHGYSFIRTGQGRVQTAALKLAEGAVARRVDLVGVVSDEERTRAREIRARRVALIPNGIAELDAPPGAPADRPADPPRLVALGRLDPARAPEAAARIMSGLRDVAEVQWIGGGEAVLANVVHAHGVPTTGWLAREDALTRLAQATACLHWSAWDAQPLSVLEAMARDVVVVASDIGANRELLGARQVCATEAQAQDLLRAVLIDPSLRAELLDEQRRRRRPYGAQRMSEQWEQTYRRLVSRRRTGRAGSPPGMAVTHVSASMDHGGAERVLVDLAIAHARAGADVTIIAPAGALDRDWQDLGVRRMLVPAAGRAPRELLATVLAVRRALRRSAPDVVHAHNVKASGVALLATVAPGRGRRVPVLTTLHGVADAEMGRSAQIMRFSAAIVAVSEELRDAVLARGLRSDRVSVIHNGVTPAVALDPARRAAYVEELGLSGHVVAAVGRLAPEKAYDRFVAAAALILRTHPDTTFLVVGDGALRSALEQRARELGIAASVRFAGMRNDARALIELADLLVFSSEREGLSIAALEALAAGTPVVAPDVPGMHALLASGAGAVVARPDPQLLAAEITHLLDDGVRRAEMGDVGRSLIEARFSATAMRGAYLDLYRRLAR